MAVEAPRWKTQILLILFGLAALMSLSWVPADRAYLLAQQKHRALSQLTPMFEKQQERLFDDAFSMLWQPVDQWRETKPLTRQELLLLHDKSALQLICEPYKCSPSLRKDAAKQWGVSWQVSAPNASGARVLLQLEAQRELLLGWFRHFPMSARVQVQDVSGQLIAEHQARIKSFHWTSILPPLVAIFFALLTRQILLSLLISLFLGSLLLNPTPWAATKAVFGTYLWEEALYKEFSFNIIFFTLALIGMINVCTRNGGIKGLIDGLVKYAATARSSRFMTAFLGLLIFFDDYANTIMVGNTMRPLTDRYKVSREKLAYLIDSTAAPLAATAVLSTWIGYEVGLLNEISTQLSLPMGGYQLFVASIPYRFYCWMTLLFVFIGVIANRDYGPMYQAEARAALEGKLLRDGAQPMVDIDMERLQPPEEIPHRSWNALIPIAVVLISGFVGLLIAGGVLEGRSFYEALKVASYNSSRVFLISALLGTFVAISLSVGQKLLSFKEAITAWVSGAQAMVFAVGILILAWAMSAMAQDLGTAYYLIAILKGRLQQEYLPLLVFFMSAAVSFATGTSWGTMGILLPTIGPLAFTIGGTTTLILSVGAVLDGSIFGDHCSPLSDTTLFSSAASACDHVDHVRTQAPYALTVMMVAATGGYLLVAFGYSVWFSVVLAILCFTAIFGIFGKAIPAADQEPKGVEA